MKRLLCSLGCALAIAVCLAVVPSTARAADTYQGYVCSVQVYDKSYSFSGYAYVGIGDDPTCSGAIDYFYVWRDFIFSYEYTNDFDLVVDWIARAAMEGWFVEARVETETIFYSRTSLVYIVIEDRIWFYSA